MKWTSFTDTNEKERTIGKGILTERLLAQGLLTQDMLRELQKEWIEVRTVKIVYRYTKFYKSRIKLHLPLLNCIKKRTEFFEKKYFAFIR